MDEKTLIKQAGRGDDSAFAQLVTQYEKQVYNLALRMTGNREDAFDLTQDTFLKAWHAIGLFQFDCKFSTWLFRIASNTCIDHMRKQHRRRTVSLTLADEDALSELDIADASLDPAVIAEAAGDQEAVLAALQSLPEDYRVALSLRAIEDMSYEEIGQALDLKPGTVKSRIARAREKMRRTLSGNFSPGGTSNLEKGGAPDEGL